MVIAMTISIAITISITILKINIKNLISKIININEKITFNRITKNMAQ